MSKVRQEFGSSKIGQNSQPVAKNNKHLVEPRDKCPIVVLALVTLAIGIYIIATTVLIAEDGVGYIGLAQNFPKNPIDVIKHTLPFGYPFLVFLVHKVTTSFSQVTSLCSWIYSAQSASLLCRVLSLIPLYFIGKLLVGRRRNFWGLLILIMLPYPAEFGSDVIREWPHILFLSTGFLFLIWGSRFGKWWMFAVAGFAAGLGHTIRAECAQIVIYGILWLLISLFLPRPNISRLKAVFVMLILLIGFAIPTAPYVKVRGKVLPQKPRELISATVWESEGIGRNNFDDTAAVYTVSGMPANILKALGRLAREVSDNLMYFFVLPLAVGLYSHFRKLQKILLTERFFVFALVVLYVVMMVLLHTNYGYISRRHCMPIVVFAVFYIPVGLQIMARWLSEKTSKNSLTVHRDRRRWFFILMAIGLGTCAAKFVKITPLRWEKQGYLEAAKWLKENTSEKDLIAVPDPRIGFYAQRPSTRMRGEKIPGNTTYVVKFLDDKRAEENINFNREVRKRYSVWMNKKEEKRKIVIYEVL